MLERHEHEQYFWDAETLALLGDVAARFERPCALCAPLLGRVWNERGVLSRSLDCDERFAADENFSVYDLYRPIYRDETYGVIICDPPFWKVSLSQLFNAIRLLAHHSFEQKLAICYPTRRAKNICGTFAKFGLEPTNYFPGYLTVQELERNRIEFFANFEWELSNYFREPFVETPTFHV